MPNGRRAAPADDSTEMPAVRAAPPDAPTRWLLQMSEVLPLEPACAKPRPAPISAGADLSAPSAHSVQLPAIRPAHADGALPSAPAFPATGQLLFSLRLPVGRQTTLPPAAIPIALPLRRQELQLR